MKKYDIILADPPWPYKARRMAQNNGKHIVGIEDEYDTMTMSDLCNLPIANIRSKNCLLYLWATGPKLQEAFELMKAWGFKYSTMAFVWDKRIPNPGYYSCSQVEYVLVGKKGKCPKRNITNTKQFLTEARTKHSKKPEEVQNRIDKHWVDCEKIELFARRYRPGWDCIGLELNGTIEDFLNGKVIPLREQDKIQKFIDEDINPALEMHGGFLAIDRYDDINKCLYVKMGGGCQGCSSAVITLQLQIRNYLIEEFPYLVEIEDVTNHHAGENPYYS